MIWLILIAVGVTCWCGEGWQLKRFEQRILRRNKG